MGNFGFCGFIPRVIKNVLILERGVGPCYTSSGGHGITCFRLGKSHAARTLSQLTTRQTLQTSGGRQTGSDGVCLENSGDLKDEPRAMILYRFTFLAMHTRK